MSNLIYKTDDGKEILVSIEEMKKIIAFEEMKNEIDLLTSQKNRNALPISKVDLTKPAKRKKERGRWHRENSKAIKNDARYPADLHNYEHLLDSELIIKSPHSGELKLKERHLTVKRNKAVIIILLNNNNNKMSLADIYKIYITKTNENINSNQLCTHLHTMIDMGMVSKDSNGMYFLASHFIKQ